MKIDISLNRSHSLIKNKNTIPFVTDSSLNDWACENHGYNIRGTQNVIWMSGFEKVCRVCRRSKPI